jgi:hypothetical protein
VKLLVLGRRVLPRLQAVRASLEQMTSDALVHHPLWGGPALALMKTTLRAVNAVPPLERKIASSQNAIRDRQRHPALRHTAEPPVPAAEAQPAAA